MKLEISMLAGNDTKAFLVELTKQIDRLEVLSKGFNLATTAVIPTQVSAKKTEVKAEIKEEEEEEDEDFAPKTKAKTKSKPSFEDEDDADEELESDDSEDDSDEDEDEDEDDSDEDDAEEKIAPSKKGKPKKVTLDDVNDACKARAASVGGKKGRLEVLEILKKKFKTESVSELKLDQYEAVIAAMKV